MATEKNSELTSWGWSNFLAIIILAAILIIGGSALGSSVATKQQKNISGAQTFAPVVEKVIAYDGQNGKTALGLLKASHQITSQETSIGVFVTGIDGIENEDNKYWMFYVDDNLAATGPDQFTTKDGQKIEWRFGSLQ